MSGRVRARRARSPQHPVLAGAALSGLGGGDVEPRPLYDIYELGGAPCCEETATDAVFREPRSLEVPVEHLNVDRRTDLEDAVKIRQSGGQPGAGKVQIAHVRPRALEGVQTERQSLHVRLDQQCSGNCVCGTCRASTARRRDLCRAGPMPRCSGRLRTRRRYAACPPGSQSRMTARHPFARPALPRPILRRGPRKPRQWLAPLRLRGPLRRSAGRG